MEEGVFDSYGDGHFDYTYMQMAYGEANCPEGKRIPTYEECMAAS